MNLKYYIFNGQEVIAGDGGLDFDNIPSGSYVFYPREGNGEWYLRLPRPDIKTWQEMPEEHVPPEIRVTALLLT